MEKRKVPLPSHSPALFHYQHFVEAFLTFSMCVLLTVVQTYRSPKRGTARSELSEHVDGKGKVPLLTSRYYSASYSHYTAAYRHRILMYTAALLCPHAFSDRIPLGKQQPQPQRGEQMRYRKGISEGSSNSLAPFSRPPHPLLRYQHKTLLKS
jgi:hypothetical protein